MPSFIKKMICRWFGYKRYRNVMPVTVALPTQYLSTKELTSLIDELLE